MLIPVVLLYLAFPLIAAIVYAYLWPTVASRAGLFITLGTVAGTVIALGMLFWIAEALVGAGISGTRLGEQSNSSGSFLGTRALIGAGIEIAAVCLVLRLLARWLRVR